MQLRVAQDMFSKIIYEEVVMSKFLVLSLSLCISATVLATSVPSSLQEKAQLVCDQFNGKTDFDYEKTYSDKIREDISKAELDSIYASLQELYGKCTNFYFPNYDQTPGVMYIETDKGLTVNWRLYIDDDGVIVGFFQKGTVDFTEVEISETMVEMRDGVKLYTRIYRAKGDTNARSVVLTRTPYLTTIPWDNKAKYFVKRGHIFVLQSIRGRDKSEGTYKLMNRLEGEDGFDAIEWIANQDFSNGNVAITGTSYDGFTALAAGIYNPPALKVIFSGGAPSEAEWNVFREGGIMLGSMLDYLRYNSSFGESVFTKDYSSLVLNKLSGNEKLEDYDTAIFGRDIEEWNLMVQANQNPEDNRQFFFERSIYEQIGDIKIPTYHIAGLRVDGDLVDTVRNFEKADKSENRDYHHLILGYWDHGNSTPYGEIGAAKYIVERYDSIVDYYLKNVPSEFIGGDRVVMESNSGQHFVGGDTFPLPSQKSTWYFSDTGMISSKDKSPLATHLDFIPFSGEGQQYYQFELAAEQDLKLFGKIFFDLYMSIDAPSVDFIINFYRKDLSGEYQFLSNCLTTQRVESESAESIVNVKIESCPILGTIKKGEHLGVVVRTNLFPTVFHNYNNLTGDGHIPAKVKFLHSETNPSSLTLSLENKK